MPKIKLILLAVSIIALGSCTGHKKSGKGCDCPTFGKVQKHEAHS